MIAIPIPIPSAIETKSVICLYHPNDQFLLRDYKMDLWFYRLLLNHLAVPYRKPDNMSYLSSLPSPSVH